MSKFRGFSAPFRAESTIPFPGPAASETCDRPPMEEPASKPPQTHPRHALDTKGPSVGVWLLRPSRESASCPSWYRSAPSTPSHNCGARWAEATLEGATPRRSNAHAEGGQWALWTSEAFSCHMLLPASSLLIPASHECLRNRLLTSVDAHKSFGRTNIQQYVDLSCSNRSGYLTLWLAHEVTHASTYSRPHNNTGNNDAPATTEKPSANHGIGSPPEWTPDTARRVSWRP